MKTAFMDLAIWKKLFLLTALIMVAAIAVIGCFSFNNAASISRNELMVVIDGALTGVANDLDNRIGLAQATAERIAWSSDVRAILSVEDEGALSGQLERYRTLNDVVTIAAGNLDAVLYLDSELLYTRERQHFYPMDELLADADGESVLSGSLEGTRWVRLTRKLMNPIRQVPTLTCLCPIRSTGNVFSDVGIAAVSIPQSELEGALSAVHLTAHASLALLDKEGRSLLDGMSDEAQADLREALQGRGGFRALSKPLTAAQWTLVALLPEADLAEPISEVMGFYLTLAAAVLAVVLALSLAMARSMTRRISDLAQLMARQGETTEIALSPITGQDEIGVLQMSYNRMLTDNRNLVRRVYETELHSRAAELKALQAQINPHFLYNILDTMNWMALEAGAKDISEVITSLADFFRMSLRKSDAPVTLAEEFEHATLYLKLQKQRMGDALRYEIHLPEEYGRYPVMKLTLQPLVENAILHGIRQKSDQAGTVRVAASVENGDLLIRVEDDGPGFSADFDPMCANEDAHFGLYITNQRLKLAYGEAYGLCFGRSSLGGAIVTIRLPAR